MSGARSGISVPRLLVAAAGSGSGKTTLVCGLLAELKRRGLRVVGYKVGPDYIDPDHQRQAGQCPAHNLDTWMMPPDRMAGLFGYTSREADIAVVEGVMGLYDGGRGGVSSSAEIAKLLGLPVVLVLNARSVGESAAAVALGFREYDRDVDLRGVVLNGVGSASHRELIAGALERVGIPLLGALRRDDALKIPERHLGLLPAGETDFLKEHIKRVRAAVAEQVDVAALLDLARSAPPLNVPPLPELPQSAEGLRIAVAQDEAFSFYYPESLRVLERHGAELVCFSPLREKRLPENIHGLLLGGGFPEVFARELEANVPMRRAIARAAASELPILAECGGMMALCRSLTDFKGRTFEMCGVIPAVCRMNDRLQTVGYVEAVTLRDIPLGPKGMSLRGHEFHFSSMTPDDETSFPYAFHFTRKRTGASYPGGYAGGNVVASYLHLNLLGFPSAAENFLQRCAAFHPD